MSHEGHRTRIATAARAYVFAAFTGVDKMSHARGHDSDGVATRSASSTTPRARSGSELERQNSWKDTQLWVTSDHGHSRVTQHEDLARFVGALGRRVHGASVGLHDRARGRRDGERQRDGAPVRRRWRSDPAGRQLLGSDDLSGTSDGFAEKAAAEIRAWQGSLMELIRTEGQGKRTQARWLSFGINGLGAALMIVVFSMTAGLTGLEIGVAGGTAVVGQRLLEAVFGEDAVRRLAQTAREDLHARCQQLLQAEQQRFLARLEIPGGVAPAVLAGHAAALRRLAASA